MLRHPPENLTPEEHQGWRAFVRGPVTRSRGAVSSGLRGPRPRCADFAGGERAVPAYHPRFAGI